MPLEILLEQQQALNKMLQEQLQTQALLIEKLQQQLEQLLRKLYGKKTEKKLALNNNNHETPIDHTPSFTNQRHTNLPKKEGRNGHRKLPASLQRIRIEHDVPKDQQYCRHCSCKQERIGVVKTEQLDYRRAELVVKEHVRYKYACRRCQLGVAVAAMPNQPIEKGLPGAGLLTEIIVSKYQDALPLHRQEQRFKRLGYLLPRSTLCDWVMQSALLLKPIADAMKQDALISSPQIYTDDTPLPVQANQKTHTGRLWVYVAAGVHGPPCTLYEYSKSRSQSAPFNYLKDYEGFLQADAYAGYDKLYASGKIIEVACWAHARRKFYDITQAVKAPSFADEAVEYIGKLYQIERQIEGRPYIYKRFYRKRHAMPVLKQFYRWLTKHQRKVFPKTPICGAISYALNHWRALMRYCSQGFLNIDNNTAERAIKPVVIGRKNYLFAGSHEGAKAAAIIYSIIESCKQCNINTFDYLKDILEKLPNTLNKDIHSLLPYNWKNSCAS